MKKISLYLILMLTAACGRDQAAVEGKALGAKDVEQAMLIEKKEGLPECNDGLRKQLAYVTETDEFYTCNEKEWKAIDIRGKEGKDGVDGSTGKDGKDGIDGKNGNEGKDGETGKDGIEGKDGKDGVDGSAGKDGKDAKTLAATEWEHPLTGALWFLTGQYFNQKQASFCPQGARFPTNEEWLSAFGMGLTNKLGDFLNTKQRAWISENTYVQLYMGSTELSTIGTQTDRDSNSSVASLNYRALCIKQ